MTQKTSNILGRRKAILCVLLALAFAVSGTLIHFALRDDAPRFNLETAGSGINFDDPSIRAHNADDGVAIVGAVRNHGGAPPTIATLTSEHTHGGFTLPVQMSGDSIGILTIPDIGLSVRVYEGEDQMELMNHGVAHFRSTSAWYGNTGLSAHNVNLDGTPGYFLNIHRLPIGAVIQYQTVFGEREYVVEAVEEISEYDWSWLGRTEDNRLTLITCITGKPNMRLVVQAVESG